MFQCIALIQQQIEKLFDMSCTLSDVITYVPFEASNGDIQSPHDCLNSLLNLISRLRGGASRYVPLLMAKVAESMPNMSNPLTHMPHTLDAFLDSSSSTPSSPQDMIKQQMSLRPPQQSTPNQSLPSPAIPSPMIGHGRSSPFGEGIQQVQTPQHERLMFETYSPSLAGQNDSPLTPPIYGMSGTQQHLFSPPNSQISHNQPRSIPMSAPDMRQEVWDGYNG